MTRDTSIKGMVEWARCHIKGRLSGADNLDDPHLQALHRRCLAHDFKARLAQPLEETRFVIVDTETTGFHAYGGDEIVSIALIEQRGLERTGEEYLTLVDPGRDVPEESQAVHGLTAEKLRGQPTIVEVLPRLLEFIDDAVLVGHHINFDMRFLNKALLKNMYCQLGNPLVDTMLLHLAYSGRMGHYTLEDVARYCQVEIRDRHTAYGDAAATAEIFNILTRQMMTPGMTVGSLQRCQGGPHAV